jgi:uncharacterized protein YggE
MFRTSLSAVVGLALLIALPGTAAAQADAPASERSLIVSGIGQASAEPDEAVIRLGVDVRGEDADAAMRRAARRMDAVIAALRDAGVAESDIRTVRLDLSQYRQRNAEREVVDRGWRVTNRVRAVVRDIEATSDAIDAAVEAGATDIDSIRFRASDPSEAVAQARVAAIESAATAAATLAEASGLEVLGVIRIVEGRARNGAFLTSGFGDTAGAEAYALSTPVEPGLVDVSSTVTVEYEIG